MRMRVTNRALVVRILQKGDAVMSVPRQVRRPRAVRRSQHSIMRSTLRSGTAVAQKVLMPASYIQGAVNRQELHTPRCQTGLVEVVMPMTCRAEGAAGAKGRSQAARNIIKLPAGGLHQRRHCS